MTGAAVDTVPSDAVPVVHRSLMFPIEYLSNDLSPEW